MKRIYLLLILFASQFSFSANSLVFSPMTQTVSGQVGNIITATVNVSCVGFDYGSPTIVSIVGCTIDDGYLDYSIGFPNMYPGDQKTITFRFLKTSAGSATQTYTFRRDTQSCLDTSLIKITVNYIAAPTCSLSAPFPVSTSGITSSGAVISWSPVTNAAGYYITFKPSAGTQPQSIDIPGTSTNGTLSYLLPSTAYTYKVYTKCANGALSSYTSGSFTTLACNPPLPATVNDATDITANSAKVSWSAVPGYTDYRVFYKPLNESGWQSVDVSGTSKTLTNLTWNSSYEYKVGALCTGNVSTNSTSTKMFTTLNTSLIYPANVVIASLDQFGTVYLHFPSGQINQLPNNYKLKKIDVYSSKLIVGLTIDGKIVIYDGKNWLWSTFSNENQNATYIDVTVGKPMKYSSYSSNITIYALKDDKTIWAIENNGSGLEYNNWSYRIIGSTGTDASLSIDAHSGFGFVAKTSSGKCILFSRPFTSNFQSSYTQTQLTQPLYRHAGAGFENYNANAPTGGASFLTSIYAVTANNDITYQYNLGDSETTPVSRPQGEPASCEKCYIDGFFSTYGNPSNMVFLPNETGYFYNGSQWTIVKTGLWDISIGSFEGITGYQVFGRMSGTSSLDNGDASQEDYQSFVSGPTLVPNPATEKFAVLNLPKQECKITIIDQSGRQIRTITTFETQYEINCSDLQNGVYIVRVENSSNSTFKRIIIKR